MTYSKDEMEHMRHELRHGNEFDLETCRDLLDEIDRLKPFEQQVNDIQEVINETEPIRFVDAEIKSGTVIDALVHGALARVIVGALVRLFIDSKCENYLEIEMQKSQEGALPEWYTVVIQKKTGMTPAQKNTKLEDEITRLRNQWVSVSERPVIDDGEDRITVFVLWEWDSKPGELFPGIGQMFIDESKVMVSDGDFDKEVIYWQYIQPLPEVQS